MQSAPLNVLFVHYGDQWVRGSEQLLLDLLKNLDPARVRPVVWCNGIAMAEAVRNCGIPVYRSDFAYYFDAGSPGFQPRSYLSLVREGIQLVRQHDIQVLHANSAAPNQWLLPVARWTRRPLLAHLHIDYLRRSRFACLLHQATLVVGVSKQVIGDFIRDGMQPDRTQVIYNGIDFRRLDVPVEPGLRAGLGIPEQAVVVTAVGSLIRRKGQDVLLRAFGLLDRLLDIRLLIVSDGPERSNLERLAAELGLQDRVHFLGYFDNLPGIYRATDIVALASRADAFGLVLAEAGHFSVPVVSTTVGGIPEVIEHEVTGLLVPPEDVGALAAALGRLAADTQYRRQLGVAGKARVERLFGVEQMARNFHTAYETLAKIPRAELGWGASMTGLRPYLSMLRRRGIVAGSPAGP